MAGRVVETRSGASDTEEKQRERDRLREWNRDENPHREARTGRGAVAAVRPVLTGLDPARALESARGVPDRR
jgi:hypothetical protein